MARRKCSTTLALFALLSLASPARAAPNDDPPAWQTVPPAASGDSVEAEEGDEDEDEPSDEDEAPTNPFASVPAEGVESSLSRALSGPEASFCKAQQAAVHDDPLLCSLSKLSVRQRCPGLRLACSNKPTESRSSWSSSSSTSLLGQGLAAVSSLVFWLLLAALVIAARLVRCGSERAPRGGDRRGTLVVVGRAVRVVRALRRRRRSAASGHDSRLAHGRQVAREPCPHQR